MKSPDPKPPPLLERRFASRFEDLSRVTLEAVRFLEAAGVSEQSAYVANLAIEELGTNILKYGYDDGAVHEILLRVHLQPGTLRVILEDDGHRFNPLDAPEPDLDRPAEERAPGGLGIHLVRQMAHRLQYERSDARNRITVDILL